MSIYQKPKSIMAQIYCLRQSLWLQFPMFVEFPNQGYFNKIRSRRFSLFYPFDFQAVIFVLILEDIALACNKGYKTETKASKSTRPKIHSNICTIQSTCFVSRLVLASKQVVISVRRFETPFRIG